jgi:predicted AAA+ superfamily ATPase
LKRSINYYLKQWTSDPQRKPLLLRGARQVGKTYAARELGKSFAELVEINFELQPDSKGIFEKDLKPERIVRELSLIVGKRITPGKTLLFLDEIQEVPLAISALRYFYEEMPSLHVIAAGSLLDFTLEKVGLPVGRVTSLYMYPLSWVEFLLAKKEDLLFSALFESSLKNPLSEVIHKKLLSILGEYFAMGGMPEVVSTWINTSDPYRCFKVQQDLADTYKQDFQKYSKKHQVKYIEILFEQIPRQLGKKFKFFEIPGEYRKRDLTPCLELLIKGNVAHSIYHTSAQGLPLGAEININSFKTLFLDIGLAQRMLGLNLKEWFLNPIDAFINQGPIVEAFVGQEILAYADPFQKQALYYWHREMPASQAEVDYIIQQKSNIIPIEVKSGTTGRLKSLHEFFKTHPTTSYAIRFSGHNYSQYEKIHSYPLYAVAQSMDYPNIVKF